MNRHDRPVPVEPVSGPLTLPVFKQPGVPDLVPIILLHRGNDGFISFHRKRGDEFEDLWSVKASELTGLFPDMIPELHSDAFYSINSFYRGGHTDSPIGINGSKHPRAFRQGAGLRWLTACFADIDCVNLGLDVGTVIGSVINAQDRGDLPPASIITRSGNGIWLFWILTADEGTDHPVRAWKEKVRLYCNVQRAIGERLVRLGADAKARDVSRITRIAGSVNTKAAVLVEYWPQLDKTGRAFRYRLGELAELLNVEIPKPIQFIERAVTKLSERGQKGQRGRWLKARDNFRRLWELRGQFRPGTRSAAAYVYTVILRSLTGDLKLTDNQVNEELLRLWGSFGQPLGDKFTFSELQSASKAEGFKFGGITNQTISDLLHITPAESDLLDNWPAAARYGPGAEAVPKLSRGENAAERRKWIVEIVTRMGSVPTGAEMIERLAVVGITAAAATVLKDMQELGYDNPRQKRKSAEKQRNLFEDQDLTSKDASQ